VELMTGCATYVARSAGLTHGDVSLVLELGTAAILWPNTAISLLQRCLPWQFFSHLLVEVLQLPLKETAPFAGHSIHLPPVDATKDANEPDVLDLLPVAVTLMATMTGSFLHAMKQQDHESETKHFQMWILPVINSCLGHHVAHDWSGVLVVLLAAVVGHLKSCCGDEDAMLSDFPAPVSAGAKTSLVHDSAFCNNSVVMYCHHILKGASLQFSTTCSVAAPGLRVAVTMHMARCEQICAIKYGTQRCMVVLPPSNFLDLQPCSLYMVFCNHQLVACRLHSAILQV